MTAAPGPTDGPELRVQRLAYAALDALRIAMPLDLCAYLHVIAGDGPQLYLRTPDLASMTATAAFDLFGALRDTIVADDQPTTRVAGFNAIAVRTFAPSSTGVFVVGRRDGTFTDAEADVVRSLCSTIGEACHTLETSATPSQPAELASVSIRVDNGAAHADVIVELAGVRARGHGSASRTTEAVALAALDAVGDAWKLGDVTEGLVGGEQVAIALVRDDDDTVRLGAALVSGDPVRAAAMAVLAATANG